MKCDGCTLCCGKLVNTPGVSPKGEWCQHCTANIGCKVYDDLPNVCKEYKCSYYEAEKCSEDLRPDNCGVIFERFNDEIFIGIVDTARPMSEAANNQIRAFFLQGFSVVLLRENLQPLVFKHEEHNIEKVRCVINGSTSI